MASSAVAAVDASASKDAASDDAATEQRALLESLFARHMRARAMLRSVAKAEQEALTEIVWMLKAVPASRRQAMVALCVERAAAGLVRDSD